MKYAIKKSERTTKKRNLTKIPLLKYYKIVFFTWLTA